MYNPRSGKWKIDKVIVKVQSKPFAHGAMRECYRMKKLSKFSQNPNWKNASNYVAKHYMKEVTRETYFDDVKLQMDSKLWGEEYSKLNVPKKVDFCQTYIIEFSSREGSPLYGVEHFIDGGYVKYNSNSGFVSDVNRLTPQAFSHLTFEKSHHQLIVVDIQGVGDLYTDPQMHTVDMKDYGEANLGTRGMALFFSSHICSPLCEMMGLTQFDLSEDDLEELHSRRWNFSSSTTRISDESASSEGDTNLPKETIGDLYRRLSCNITSAENLKQLDLRVGSDADDFLESPLSLESPSLNIPEITMNVSSPTQDYADAASTVILPSPGGVGTSSSVKVKMEDISNTCESLSVLGQIHLDLAHYNEAGRFSVDSSPNLKSAMYHLLKSAQSGIVESLYTVAHIYLQQLHNEFKQLTVEATAEHECEGMEYLIRASEKGLKPAMLETAKAFDTGIGLGKAPKNKPSIIQRYQNWPEAIKWYSKALSAQDNETLNSDSLTESDSILKRMAEMYRSGGHHLEKNFQKAGELYTEAADAAMNAMKGKLSNRFYMLAEEVWSEITD